MHFSTSSDATPLCSTVTGLPAYSDTFLSPQSDLHTIQMFGYSDTVRSSRITVTLFGRPSTVTVSGKACCLILTFSKRTFTFSAVWKALHRNKRIARRLAKNILSTLTIPQMRLVNLRKKPFVILHIILGMPSSVRHDGKPTVICGYSDTFPMGSNCSRT